MESPVRELVKEMGAEGLMSEVTESRNGKVNPAVPQASREQLEAVDIPAIEKAAANPSRLAPHQPSKSDILRQAEEAMTRLAKGQNWDDWVKVMRAFDMGRSTAMLEANTNRPFGPRYTAAFGKWLRCHPAFEAVHKTDRSRFLKCFDNLEEINNWRCKNVPPHQLLKLNYPPTVMKHWESWKKKQAGTVSEENEPAPRAEPTAPGLTLEMWKAGSSKIKGQILDYEGRNGLMKLMSAALLAELKDALIGQEIQAASTSTTLAVNLTKLLQGALSGVDAADSPLAKIDAKLKASGRDCRDVLIAIATRKKSKHHA